MVDILNKITTLRSSTAVAELYVSRPETIQAILNRTVPKGDVMEFSRAAGLLAIKKTSDVIPDCHPLPIEYASFTYQIEEDKVIIQAEVATIYKTGVEVEAMHGVSIAALTMYDMLKPIDKGIEIRNIRLLHKNGGKSDFKLEKVRPLKAAVIVCSDTVYAGKKEDKAGKSVSDLLQQHDIETASFQVIADEAEMIRASLQTCIQESYDLVLFTGGTGLSPRDITPETVLPMLDREIPGLMEAARAYGQERTPYAMLSRGVAGFAGKTLVITLPGSTRGAVETMQALFPYVKHIFRVLSGMQHES
ncbi:MAG: bifunctional molybdenum cofactor biosynthesis protein MoaC/MoaB [Chitinophagaceae bacterium]|nr:bifunctional molybdenum cofactor biosynthesis protein MoaC/MoaB [Chitinophagaceae bacterium]